MDVSAPKIDVRGIAARYPGSARQIFRGLNFALARGDILTILGPNGAGKSTLLKCLVGLLLPETGTVLVDGDNIGSLPAGERARRMAVVSQNEQSSFALSVEEIVLTGRAPHLGMFGRPGPRERSLADKSLAAVGISNLAHRSFAELSGGERQLTRIARALVQESPILILDEPTAHLDLANQMQVLKAILKLVARHSTIIMTSHDPAHAFVCGGSALLLNKGGFATCGTVADVLNDRNLSDLYEIPLSIVRTKGGNTVAPDYTGLRADHLRASIP